MRADPLTRFAWRMSLKVEGCRVSLDACPEENFVEVLELETQPAHRGQGLARGLMNRVCRAADRSGVVLRLCPGPFGVTGMGKAALTEFYRSLGFDHIGVGDCMQRDPKEAE